MWIPSFITRASAGIFGSEMRAARLASLLGLAGLALLWPALWNRFPLIFSDSGTYISQAMELHLGWDRPPFYSFFLLATDWGVSLWPPVLVQAALAVWLIARSIRIVVPSAGVGAICAVIGGLAALTALPFVTAEIMPDIFSSLMVLALFVLVWGKPGRLEQYGLVGLIAGAIAVHDTNLPIFAGLLLVVLVPLSRSARGRVPWRAVVLVGGLGVAALLGVNMVARGQIALAPYGSNFLLARLIANGPARRTLARDCPHYHWALCRYRRDLPDSADRFLWARDSAFYRAGGPMRMIGQTDQIVARTLVEQPRAVAREAGADIMRQLFLFKAGSGLRPWRRTAAATIKRDFPAGTVASFKASLQERRQLVLPRALIAAQDAVAGIGMAVTLALLGAGAIGYCANRRLLALAMMVGAALLGNAMLTGALSGPHDRYQARIVWLAVLVAGIGGVSAYSLRRSRPARMIKYRPAWRQRQSIR